MHFTVRKQPYYTDKGSQFLLHTSVTGGRICFVVYFYSAWHGAQCNLGTQLQHFYFFQVSFLSPKQDT